MFQDNASLLRSRVPHWSDTHRGPDLPEEMAEALDAEGRLIARFTPSSEQAPAGTVALRVSVAGFDRVLAALDEIQKSSR